MPTLLIPQSNRKYEAQPFSIERKVEWWQISSFCALLLENAILNLDEAQLQTPYREGGWTVQNIRLVHHISDSHYQCLLAGLSLR
jgi:hypothetical protein